MSLSTCPTCGTPLSAGAVSCPKCGRALAGRPNPAIAVSVALGLGLVAALGAFVASRGVTSLDRSGIHKAVHSGQREQVAFFYDLLADCEVAGYPEVTVDRAPRNGEISTEQGKAYPSYTRENIRFECNRNLQGATLVFYQSDTNFHGRDSFTIRIRFPDATLWTQSYRVEVQ